MKCLLLSLLLVLTVLAAPPAPIDVVFDLDWTLTYTTRAETAAFEPENLFRHEGKIYRISDHAIAVLKFLHQTPPFRVSFFSGGDPARNQALIGELYARANARSWRGSSRYQPFRVGDKSILTEVPAPAGARFPERYKKDLKKLFPDINFDNVVLIDDVEKFVVPGQERNVLWLQQTFDDIPQFENLKSSTGLRFAPVSKEAWALERNKLTWALGAILRAHSAAKDSGKSFTDELQRLTHDANGSLIPRDEVTQLELSKAGLTALGLPATPLVRFAEDAMSACMRDLVNP